MIVVGGMIGMDKEKTPWLRGFSGTSAVFANAFH
jgi:hypothetical protein